MLVNAGTVIDNWGQIITVHYTLLYCTYSDYINKYIYKYINIYDYQKTW